MLNHQRRLTLPPPTVVTTATSSACFLTLRYLWQMNKYADTRKLPHLRLGPDGRVVTHWVEDADPAGGARVRRSSRFIKYNSGGRPVPFVSRLGLRSARS